jgi:hypothetical protein
MNEMKRMTQLQRTVRFAIFYLLAVIAFPFQAAAQPPQGHHHDGGSSGANAPELGMSAAFDKDGRLWAVTREATDGNQFVLVQSSADMGKTWSSPKSILQEPEPVAARGEERPKIAFGNKGEIYVAYTKPIAKPHVGEIRFLRSTDGGKTFSKPITVHANREVITHAFGSMIVDRAGRIYVAWIDGRGAQQSKARGEPYRGSAIYYAVSEDAGATFKGDYKLTDHTCECCRISLALNPQGNPVAFWRHIFSPNIRDHAVAELSPSGSPATMARVTFDDWRVDACPHHGPSLAYGTDKTRHQVWFNGKEGDEGGVYYAATAPGAKPGKPVSLGNAQASHADIAVQGRHIAIAWKQFDGQVTAIVGRLSEDAGHTWVEKELARTSGESDKPYLVSSGTGTVLVWRTQNEGIRTIRTSKEAS